MALTLLIVAAAVLALSGTALGIFSVWQTRTLAGILAARLEASHQELETGTQTLAGRLEILSVQVTELERQPAITLSPGIPRPGMNVVKRTQALRLHRRGERPEQIAMALDLPRQKVELHKSPLGDRQPPPAASARDRADSKPSARWKDGIFVFEHIGLNDGGQVQGRVRGCNDP